MHLQGSGCISECIARGQGALANASSPLRCITKYIHFCLFNKVKVIPITCIQRKKLDRNSYQKYVSVHDMWSHFRTLFCVYISKYIWKQLSLESISTPTEVINLEIWWKNLKAKVKFHLIQSSACCFFQNNLPVQCMIKPGRKFVQLNYYLSDLK